MLVGWKLSIFKEFVQIKTSIKDSTRRVDPICPSKNLKSFSVPFLEYLNKKCSALKKYTLSWRKMREKARWSSLASCWGRRCLPFTYKTLRLITLKAFSVMSFNNFSKILMSNFNTYLLTYTLRSIIHNYPTCLLHPLNYND